MIGSIRTGVASVDGVGQQLATLLGEHDLASLRHSWRVGRLAEAMAASMDVPPEDRRAARLTGLLHDVGKLGISPGLLGKPMPLTAKEADVVRAHASIGGLIVHPLVSSEVADAVRHHHERIDGGGYPDGLRGGELSWMTRLVSVADTYDALVSRRPYRRGCSRAEAFRELRRVAGTQLDAGMVEVLVNQVEGEAPEPDTGCELRPVRLALEPFLPQGALR